MYDSTQDNLTGDSQRRGHKQTLLVPIDFIVETTSYKLFLI